MVQKLTSLKWYFIHLTLKIEQICWKCQEALALRHGQIKQVVQHVIQGRAFEKQKRHALFFCASCSEHVVLFLVPWSLDHWVTVSAGSPSCLKIHLSYLDNLKKSHLCRTLEVVPFKTHPRWFVVFTSTVQTPASLYVMSNILTNQYSKIFYSRSSTAVIWRSFISILLLLLRLAGWHDKHPENHRQGPESGPRPWLKAKLSSGLAASKLQPESEERWQVEFTRSSLPSSKSRSKPHNSFAKVRVTAMFCPVPGQPEVSGSWGSWQYNKVINWGARPWSII